MGYLLLMCRPRKTTQAMLQQPQSSTEPRSPTFSSPRSSVCSCFSCRHYYRVDDLKNGRGSCLTCNGSGYLVHERHNWGIHTGPTLSMGLSWLLPQ